MSSSATTAAPALSGPVGGRGRRALLGVRRPPAGLLGAAVVVGLLAALPAAYLAIAVAEDLPGALDVISSSRTASVVAGTVALTVAVMASAVALALPLAWLTVRTDLPGRRLWATLCALPLVIPSYVGAYLFVAALGPAGLLREALGVEQLPSIYGFGGAWIVLTLFTYPLVLIPARAALRRIDPQLEEAARSMGRSPAETFRSVVVPQLRPALAAGALLVGLYVLSDFGAVSILRFDSLTPEIYIAYQSSFDRAAAAGLGAVLVGLMLVLLYVNHRVRVRTPVHRLGPGTARPPVTHRLGRWRWPALGFCAAVTTLGLLLPAGVLVYWATKGIASAQVPWDAVAASGGNSLITAGSAALAGAAAGTLVALLASRYPSPIARLLERFSHTGYALPGILVALAMVFFATRVVSPLYQTLALLVFALTVHYLPLAITSVGAALTQASPRVEDAARSLGRGPAETFRTVTLPLIRGGILAGAALLFLHVVKELPATLILAPLGFETLATEIWSQTQFGFYEASAIPALVLLLISAPPLYMLSERGTMTA